MDLNNLIQQVKETPDLLKFIANDKLFANDMRHIGLMSAGVKLARKNAAKRAVDRYQASKEGGTL